MAVSTPRWSAAAPPSPSLGANMTIRQRLAVSYRDNADRPRDLSVSHKSIGDVLLHQGDLNGALAAAYRESVMIGEA
jgi:hypothetical protein